MPARRPPHPTPHEVKLDQVLHALSDPIRRDVLYRISVDGPQYCGDLEYDVSKSTMSHHFKVLREAGLLYTEVLGTHRRISRRDSVIEDLFPGLLSAVGLVPALGGWDETAPSE